MAESESSWGQRLWPAATFQFALIAGVTQLKTAANALVLSRFESQALPYLYLDCGTEDQLLPFSRSLADLLLQRKIPHEYRELPGNHNWQYWDAQVREVLRVAAQKIPQARLSPVARAQASPRLQLQLLFSSASAGDYRHAS